VSVYFLRPNGMEGPVKIGSSRCPPVRLMEYARWSPYPLEIAATFPGGVHVEQQFHSMFRERWLHHEWFEASLELTQVIAEIQAGSFSASRLPSQGLVLRINSDWVRDRLAQRAAA
jgi:hypothetical protein